MTLPNNDIDFGISLYDEGTGSTSSLINLSRGIKFLPIVISFLITCSPIEIIQLFSTFSPSSDFLISSCILGIILTSPDVVLYAFSTLVQAFIAFMSVVEFNSVSNIGSDSFS